MLRERTNESFTLVMLTLLRIQRKNYLFKKSTQRLFIVFSFFVILTSCSKPLPVEQQILTQLERAKLSIENLNASDLKDVLAPDFEITGGNKQYDYELIKKTMLVYSLRKQKINIILSSTSITPDPYNTQLATLESNVLITGSKGILPEDGKLYRITSQWRLYDDWKLTRLSWK
jgi:hypothetical protein